jgi:hypothetical protein
VSRAPHDRRRDRDLPPRLAALGLVVLMLAHLLVAAGRIQRDPAPRKTFHDHDEHLVHHPMIFRGARRAPSLPISELVPADMDGLGPWETLDAAFANSPERTRAYRTTTPLHFVVAAIPATLLGVGVWTVRLGPIVLLWSLLLVVYDLARRTASSRAAGLLAAALLGALPAVHQGVVVGVPALGNMLGVALGLWALHRSDGLSRLGWAAAAGVLLALTTRWGESVGDGLESLVAVAGPAVLVALVPVARLFREGERLRAALGLLGAGLAAGLGWSLTDRWWLGLHLERYVLAEAGVTGPSPSAFDRVGNAVEVLSRTWPNYPEALTWSLAGPFAVGAFVVGSLGWVLLGGRRLQAVWLLASVLGGGVALSLSDKGQDTYAVGLLPAFAVLAAAGAWRLPGPLRWSALPAVGLVGAAGLFQAHMDLPALHGARCDPQLATWLAVDPGRCERGRNDQPAVYHWFKEWRREPNPQDLARSAIGRWIRYEDGRRWLDALPPGALVLLQRPPGPGGGADVLVLLAQAIRPDIYVHTVKGMSVDALTGELMARHDDVWVLTFVRDMTRGGGVPQEPIGGLQPLTRDGGWRHAHIYRRTTAELDVDAGSTR